jgi:GNAT superfamily N-acetyltransferase
MRFKLWLESGDVGYEINYNFRNGVHIVTAVDDMGNEIGKVRFVEVGDNLKCQPGSILYVDPNYRRKGIATAMYKYIEDKTGKLVVMGGNLTGAGRMFWNKYRPESL